MDVCCEFVRRFHVGCSGGREWECCECSTESGRRKRLRAGAADGGGGGGLGLLDMNASPPQEDGGGGDEAGFSENPVLERATSFNKMQDAHNNPLSSPATHTDMRHVASGDHVSQSFLDGFPVQYEDLFVTSVGKIDPRVSFHNTTQIWPVGYKSMWHDRLTGSIFECNVLDGGDCAPVFRVHRYPCTKQPFPNASTMLHQRKRRPNDENDTTGTDDSSINRILHDVIGEFSIESRTPLSAWQMTLETLMCACHHAFNDLHVISFRCNHRVSEQNPNTPYNFDPLYKFSYSAGPISVFPNSIRTANELESTCLLLRKWLQADRFGFDADFVQELIEQLPGVSECSQYIPLNSRYQNSMAQTVGNGFFTVLRNLQQITSIVLQAHEFCSQFHKVLGQDTLVSRQKLEFELVNPRVGDLKPLANVHIMLLKVLVNNMLTKVKQVFDPFGDVEYKSRNDIFPFNEITWPELARRYVLAVLSINGNLEKLDGMYQGCGEVFHCLNGDGGRLGGSLAGVAAMEADAVVLGESAKRIFSSIKGEIVNFTIDEEVLRMGEAAREENQTENEIPEWITALEPVRKLPTNVGSRIRNCVRESLAKNPPKWATIKLLHSISKGVYKGNASGPTKKIVCSILEKMRRENPLTKKTAKESNAIRTLHDVIIKRCRMVLRAVAAKDEDRAFFTIAADSIQKADSVFGYAANISASCQLDFRVVDLRLDAGFYGAFHESFMEDVREVWRNLRVTYRNKPKQLELIETFSKNLEELYENEVLPLVKKAIDCANDSTEAKEALNTMIIDTIKTELIVAPWEELVCKVCGMDKNDNILLLCDRCDAEYHTYCLDPPLRMVPEGSWYCPPCVSFLASQATSGSTLAAAGGVDKAEMGEDSESLAAVGKAMGLMEYWELGVEQRVLLLKFLCDEADKYLKDETNRPDQHEENGCIEPTNAIHNGDVGPWGEKTDHEPLVGGAAEILSSLKAKMLEMEAAVPLEAHRPLQASEERLGAWRKFVGSAESVHEMVQATIIFEQMIKIAYLKPEWRYWSSPSTAARITAVTALAARIYALDAAIEYEKRSCGPEPMGGQAGGTDGA